MFEFAVAALLAVALLVLLGATGRLWFVVDEMRTRPRQLAALGAFLLVWWFLAGAPAPRTFLRLHGASTDDIWFGLAVGAIGWTMAIATSAIVALVLLAAGYDASATGEAEPLHVPEVLLWLTALPVWRKLIVVA